MKHPNNIPNYSKTIAELAKDIGNLKYDSLAEFLSHLGDDLMRQAEADKKRGRPRLASQLEASAKEIYEARDRMFAVWKICEPYMK